MVQNICASNVENGVDGKSVKQAFETFFREFREEAVLANKIASPISSGLGMSLMFLRVLSSPAVPRIFIHDQLFLCGVEF